MVFRNGLVVHVEDTGLHYPPAVRVHEPAVYRLCPDCRHPFSSEEDYSNRLRCGRCDKVWTRTELKAIERSRSAGAPTPDG